MNTELLISLVKVSAPLGAKITVGRQATVDYRGGKDPYHTRVFMITILEYPKTDADHISDFFARYVASLNENGFITTFSRDNCGLFVNKELAEQITISRPTMIYDFKVEIKPFLPARRRSRS